MTEVNEIFEGFVTVAAVSPMVKPGDCKHNAIQLNEAITEAEKAGAKLICAPELSITGYTCGDLFLQDALLERALASLRALVLCSEKSDSLVFVGLPLAHKGKLYNVAAAMSGGRLLGIVPKSYLYGRGDSSELRVFAPAPSEIEDYIFNGYAVPFGANLLFKCKEYPDFTVAAEICEDLWTPLPPSSHHSRGGASVIVNLSAESETVGKEDARRLLVSSQSARAVCAYIYTNAAYGESTGDAVYAGHSMIYESAVLLAERKPFKPGFVITDIDVGSLSHDRKASGTFSRAFRRKHKVVEFSQAQDCGLNHRKIDPSPFVPQDTGECAARCEKILRIQTYALIRRLEHVDAKKVILGLSGGLDSTLALLVIMRAVKLLGGQPDDILAVSMPGPGTSGATKENARLLANALGIPLQEIWITDLLRQHLSDIGHSEEDHDVVFENAQARIRTLVLMNLANKYQGLVVGTGDLSELALGWTTYGGDQLSMYGVNAGVPKTLIRYIIGYVASLDAGLSPVLQDILYTPVSPELLPPENGEISQKTEDILGSYELHDFFLYHAVRRGKTPSLILKLAVRAFDGKYEEDEIRERLRVFYSRFFAHQFKRSALADGPKVGSVSLSSTEWNMPGDLSGDPWVQLLDV